MGSQFHICLILMLTGSSHKRRKRNRRKRHRYESDEDKFDELLELGSSDGKNGVESQRGSWRLSTDGFSASWDIVRYLLSC